MPFDWSLNPYVGCRHACVFCFARGYYVTADRGTAEDFPDRIFAKVNFVDVLGSQLAARSLPPSGVALGTATDPYQPVEGRYRLTRGVLELLARYQVPVSLLTKSPLILRDVDILAELARLTRVRVYFSITTVALDRWRQLEQGTANPFKRLKVLRALVDAGVPAGVLMSPILPGITDSTSSLLHVARAAVEHRATFFEAQPLRLMPTVREFYLRFISAEYPEMSERYARAYPGVHASDAYRAALKQRVERVRQMCGFTQRVEAAARPERPARPTYQLPLAL